MSIDQQPTLDDYASEPRWRPQDAQRARRCRCGSHVTPSFIRLYSDDSGRVHACPECADAGAIMAGAATDPEIPRRGREWRGDR